MTHRTMYGIGYSNRMRGVLSAPLRPVLVPYPTAKPAEQYPESVGLKPIEIGNLGDALTAAMSAERVKVNEEAADYRLPLAARTRSQAIMALILLMRSAESEDPRSAGYYKKVANEAAYKYRASTIGNILKTGVDLTKNLVRTGRLARDVYALSGGPPVPAPVVKAVKAAAVRTVRVSAAPDAETAPPGESWQDKLATLPTWAPWVAGGVVVLAAAWLLLPSAKPVTVKVSQPVKP